jgi:Probable transposase
MTVYVTTQEFQVDIDIPEQWFDCLKRVWNESLFHLSWLQHYKRAEKNSHTSASEIRIFKKGEDYIACCDIGKEVRIDRKKSWNPENIEWRPCCSIVPSRWLTEPPISSYKSADVCKLFALKKCEWAKESGISSVYLNDYVSQVIIPAWESYQKGIRQKPSYKRLNEKVTTIVSASFRAQCSIDGNIVALPKLGHVAVEGLQKRLMKYVDDLVVNMRQSPDKYDILSKKIAKVISLEAIVLAKESGIKKPTKEQVAGFKKQIHYDDALEKALDYFSKPGSFKIIKRNNKTYLQISAYVEHHDNSPAKQVGVDTGLDLLIDGTNGLKVKHLDFNREHARIDLLNEKLSKMKYGSNNYKKTHAKIAKIHDNIKRSRKGYQAYWASQLADVNHSVAIKQVNPSKCFKNPTPRLDKSKTKYIPNGKTDAKAANRELANCSLSQFATLTEQQCAKRGRNYAKVVIEAEATKEEILEVAELPPVGAASELAQNLDSSETREGEKAISSTITGKGSNPTGNNNLFSQAGTPVPPKKRRNKKRESIIG